MFTSPGKYAKIESAADGDAESLSSDGGQYAAPIRSRTASLRAHLGWFCFLVLCVVDAAYLYVHRAAAPPTVPAVSGKLEALIRKETAVGHRHYAFDNGYGEHRVLANGTAATTVYAVETSDRVDENWLELFYELSRLHFTPEEADHLGLDTARLADGSYMASLDVFHQLHCIDILRHALSPDAYPPKGTQKERDDHHGHCINYLRQTVMCNVDFTPLEYHDVPMDMPDGFRHRSKFDHAHQCVDWDTLYDWAMARRVKVPEEWSLIHYPKDQ